MKNRTTLLFGFFFLCSMAFGTLLVTSSANAAPHRQGFVTATPGPDGRILYKVVDGDNCGQVALLHNITIEQLKSLNPRLDQNCTLSVGQDLVVGLILNATSTPGPAPTSLPPTPSITPAGGTTQVCVLLFDDVNGDALRQETEFGIDGGAVSLTNLNGSYAQTQSTNSTFDPDTLEPNRACFVDVPAGDYNITVAPPDSYNPTMILSYNLTVQPGAQASVVFGAQSKTITVAEPEDAGGGRSSVLGIFGGLLLLAGVGLGYYAWRSGQPQNRLKGNPLDKR